MRIRRRFRMMGLLVGLVLVGETAVAQHVRNRAQQHDYLYNVFTHRHLLAAWQAMTASN